MRILLHNPLFWIIKLSTGSGTSAITELYPHSFKTKLWGQQEFNQNEKRLLISEFFKETLQTVNKERYIGPSRDGRKINTAYEKRPNLFCLWFVNYTKAYKTFICKVDQYVT